MRILVVLVYLSACGIDPPCEKVINEICFSGYQGYISEVDLSLAATAPKKAAEFIDTDFDEFGLEHPFYVVFEDLPISKEGDYNCNDPVLRINKRWMHTEKQRCNAAGITLGHEFLHHYATEFLNHGCNDDGMAGHNVPWIFEKWAKETNNSVMEVAEYQSFIQAGEACQLNKEE